MDNQQEQTEQLEQMLAGGLPEEVPADVQAVAREHLAVLRERMEQPSGLVSSVWATFAASRNVRWAAFAAAAVLIVAAVFGVYPGQRTCPIAFAEVIKNLEIFRPYTYTVEIVPGGDLPVRREKVMRPSPTLQRIESEAQIRIENFEEGKTLTLFPKDKLACLQDELNPVPGNTGFEVLRFAEGLTEGTPEYLGERKFDGRKAYGFHHASPYNDITLWVDAETELPVRMEIFHPKHGNTIISSDFEWDVVLDPALFDTTPPEDYRVQVAKIPETRREYVEVPFRPYANTMQVFQGDGTVEKPYRVVRYSASKRKEVRADGTIRFFDLEAGKLLTLYPDTKKAELTKTPAGGQDPNLLEEIANFPRNEDLGSSVIDGHSVVGFRSVLPGDEFTFWVDPATELPVRVEVLNVVGGRRFVMTDFDFETPMDESGFSTDIPSGYTEKWHLF